MSIPTLYSLWDYDCDCIKYEALILSREQRPNSEKENKKDTKLKKGEIMNAKWNKYSKIPLNLTIGKSLEPSYGNFIALVGEETKLKQNIHSLRS